MQDLPDPMAWAALFEREAPVLVEIGPGKGEFLIELARQRPEASVLGLEYKNKRARWIAQKVLREDLPNVRVMPCEALGFLESLAPAESVEELWINFPDPWPKRRHRRRRLFQRSFVETVLRVLKPGGFLTAVTDHQEYGAQILTVLELTPQLTNTLGPWRTVPWLEGYIRTIHFDKFEKRGRSFKFVRFQKEERNK